MKKAIIRKYSYSKIRIPHFSPLHCQIVVTLKRRFCCEGIFYVFILDPQAINSKGIHFSLTPKCLFSLLSFFLATPVVFTAVYLCGQSLPTENEKARTSTNTIILSIKLLVPYCVLLFLVFIYLTLTSFYVSIHSKQKDKMDL